MSRLPDTASMLAERSACALPHHVHKAWSPPLIWGNSVRVLCMTGGGVSSSYSALKHDSRQVEIMPGLARRRCLQS